MSECQKVGGVCVLVPGKTSAFSLDEESKYFMLSAQAMGMTLVGALPLSE